jgi:putative transcriptional regulator
MTLEGKLLISHPNCPKDSFFHRTIIYLYQHDNEKGSIGVILNKPSRYSIADICADHEIEFTGAYQPIYHGGPVNTNALVLLHTRDWSSTNSIFVSNNFRISSDTNMLKKIAIGDAPKKFRLFGGLSGWAPGQLLAELAGKWPYRPENSWLIADPTEELLFDQSYQKQWESALRLSSSQMFSQYF